jgi:hypothetical protein
MPEGIDWFVVGPLVANALAQLLAAERERTGLTNEEIFANNDVKLDENEAKLLEDLERLKGADGE